MQISDVVLLLPRHADKSSNSGTNLLLDNFLAEKYKIVPASDDDTVTSVAKPKSIITVNFILTYLFSSR